MKNKCTKFRNYRPYTAKSLGTWKMFDNPTDNHTDIEVPLYYKLRFTKLKNHQYSRYPILALSFWVWAAAFLASVSDRAANAVYSTNHNLQYAHINNLLLSAYLAFARINELFFHVHFSCRSLPLSRASRSEPDRWQAYWPAAAMLYAAQAAQSQIITNKTVALATSAC